MADNRIYLKCKVCGKKVFIAKKFVGWFLPPYTQDKTNNEFNEHDECITDFDGEIFELVYENSEVQE